ncbi:MAG TPA: maleylpyruvate isomerase N-terminal domain-containing protein [Vicinamibacterales bacterium]
MPLTPIPPTDTRLLFRHVGASLVALLRRLPEEAWTRPAVGAWQVRDVVAHLIDISMRRLSFHRDRHVPPPPPFPIQSERDFARFINQINADWVGATRRLSMRQLADLYETASHELADFMESVPFDAPGLFGVSWAGEMESAGWFDIGREFTEQWHHQAQICEAVGTEPMADPAWLHATLLIALRGLPHAYRNHDAPDGTTLTLDVSGPAGGTWTLERAGGAWRLMDGAPDAPAARAAMTDDAAWRLLFNGLRDDAARAAIAVTGDVALAAPLLKARSIVI